MSQTPLMPKATAVWLVENTSLTFEQIAEFCGLHVLEVKGIADGDVAAGIKGMDPVSSGQITREELARATAEPRHRLSIARSKVMLPPEKSKRAPRYTPVSRRQDRPNAILWLLRYHPELRDTQIIKLVGTTKPTIQAIRERSHWNSATLQPQDPVALALCTQIDLDAEVAKAAIRVTRERGEADVAAGRGAPAGTLAPTRDGVDTTGTTDAPADPADPAADEEVLADQAFANFREKVEGDDLEEDAENAEDLEPGKSQAMAR